MKELATYISEGSAIGNLTTLKDRIIKMLDTAETDDLLGVINILDKNTKGIVYGWLTEMKGVPEKFANRIIDSDKRGEIGGLVVDMDEMGNIDSLPSFKDYVAGDNLYSLFTGIMSKNLVRSIYDIEGSSGTGVIGKGEILLNVFVQNFGTDFKGKHGDVHITDDTGVGHEIEIKTAPHGHPGDRDTKSFMTVIEEIENKFNIDKETADNFFKVSNGKKSTQDAIQSYMDTLGGNDKTKKEDVVRSILYCLLCQSGRQNETDTIFKESKLGPETIFKGNNVDMQSIVNLAGAVQMKCYMDSHPETEYLCIINNDNLDYKIIKSLELRNIDGVLSTGIVFTNSMKKDYAAGGQTSTMKIGGFSK